MKTLYFLYGKQILALPKTMQIGIFAVLMFASANLFAQSTDTLFKSSVQEIMALPVRETWQEVKITTASLNEENANAALAMTRVVTEEQIRLRGYRSLKDLLEDLPDFQLFDASSEQAYTNYTVRGVNGQNRFILLLDGFAFRLRAMMA